MESDFKSEYKAGKKILGSKEKIFYQIRDAYLYVLTSFFEIPEDIPNFKIYFVIEATVSDYEPMLCKEVVLIEKNSKTINELHFDGDGIEINGCTCTYSGKDTDLIAIFEMDDFSQKSILYFFSKHFFFEYMSNIQRSDVVENANVLYEENMYISYAVTEYFLWQYFTDVNFINSLSSETYEGAHIQSRMYLSERGSDRGKKSKSGLTISFSNPIQFTANNTRQIRKLLEISNNELALVVGSIFPKSKLGHLPGRTDGYYFRYYPSINTRFVKGFSKETPKDYECEIKFKGFMSWELISYDTVIKYSKGKYTFAYKKASNEEALTKTLRKFFGRTETNIKYLLISKIIREAKKQKHGTLLLFSSSESAICEAERLCKLNRAMGIRRISLAKKFDHIQSITSIDGAIILDFYGNCYCLGAILDGDAVVRGNTSRGSRYNSAVNYVMRRAKESQIFYAIIISEDGTTDLINPSGDVISL